MCYYNRDHTHSSFFIYINHNMLMCHQFILAGYPSAFATAPKKTSSRRKSEASTTNTGTGTSSHPEWCWLCPTCVTTVPDKLSGCDVKVWWSGDNTYYTGRVGEYDRESGRHRVQYQDSEWEFLHLSGEGYLLHMDAERLARIVEIVQTEATNSVISRKRSKRR
jgi:hypothetical protein